MPFPSQQSGYSIPLMVAHVMNESTKPHRGIKGSVKDCGYIHEHTDGRLTKLGKGRRKWQQFSQSELLIQAISSTRFASCTVCMLILLDLISYTLIQILTHSQSHSIHAFSNRSYSLSHTNTHANTFHPPDLLWVCWMGRV